MISLNPGQSLLLNNRLWSLRQVRPAAGRQLVLDVIGVSAAAQGMTRQLPAAQVGNSLFIAQKHGGYWHADLTQDWQPGDFGPVLVCRPATALDVLDAHTRQPATGDLPNRFSWSYSRGRLYRTCPRAYYYHYYAAWEGWQTDAPEPVQQTYLLKNLTNIDLWAGRLIHESIQFALARLKAGQPVAPAAVVRQMQNRARADFQTSQDGLFRQQPAKHVGFAEHFYREPIPHSEWRAAWNGAQAKLLTFLNSPLYRELSAAPPDTFLDVEALQSFEVDAVTVWVQIDLARAAPNTVHLFDWKSGAVDLGEARRQLAIYALCARHKWPEQIRGPVKATLFALAENRLHHFDFSEADGQAARAEIKADIARLRGLLLPDSGNLAEIRRFPMIEAGEICRQCRFRALCGRD